MDALETDGNSKQETSNSNEISQDQQQQQSTSETQWSSTTTTRQPPITTSNRLNYRSRDGTYFSQLYNQPFVTTLSTFGHVANYVRNPYELINDVDGLVRHVSANQNSRSAGQHKRSSENFARTLNQNRHSLTPDSSQIVQEMDTFVADGRPTSTDSPGHNRDDDVDTFAGTARQSPIPVLPPIEASKKRGRLEPLTIEEYETKLRTSATDLELIERVFAGSMSCNQLRAALWPYLFGLILHRGKFEKISHPDCRSREAYLFIEHEANNSRWRELKKLYEVYQAQWKAILPDQELRFSTYRERKSLIERDVIRCDRLHPFYSDDSQNLSKLTSLLMTYMMYDFDIGYVQGMSDLAGPILHMYNGDLVKSFWIFVEVMKLFRRNFELTQKTIQFQLSCLYQLVKSTDPVFASYLEENESSNCFFAFRAIVCQFKRELMKEDENDYSNVLFLWDTIWCAARRSALQNEMQKLTEEMDSQELLTSGGDTSKQSCEQKPITDQPTSVADNPFAVNVDPNQADSLRYKLTETEIFVLALCLSMIRRERDIIMANKLDSTDIHLHFIDPKLATDLNGFIEHAINIYSYLKDDFDLTKLTSPKTSKESPAGEQAETASIGETSPTSADGYDSLSDFMIITSGS